MTAKIYLEVIDEPTGEEPVLVAGILPLFAGKEPDEDLACGQCKGVIGKGMSTLTLAERMPTTESGTAAVLQCVCGAYLRVNKV